MTLTPKQVSKLQEYSELFYDELSELITILLNLLQYEPYLSKNLYIEAEKELKSILDWYERHTEIHEEEKIVKTIQRFGTYIT